MTRDAIEKEVLNVIQHKTLEEHVATQLVMNLIDKYTAEKVQEYEDELLETLDDISNKPWRAIRHIRELYERNVRQDPDWYEEVARDYMLLEIFYSNGGANKIEELLADPEFNVNDPDLQAELSKLKEEE